MHYFRRVPVLFYFTTALLITYVVGIGVYVFLRRQGIHLSWLGDLVPRFGPSLAGVCTVSLLEGRQGLEILFARAIRWRAPLSIYVVSIVLPPLITLAVFLFRGYSWESFDGHPSTIFGVFAAQFLMAILFAGLGEELGWRGFMLPQLCERHSPLVASLIVAAAWFAWHLPAYVLTDKAASDPIPPFAAMMLLLSIVLSWVYFRSGQSLLFPIMLHGSVNASYYSLEQLFPHIVESPAFQPGFDWTVAAVWTLVTVSLLASSAVRPGFLDPSHRFAVPPHRR